MERFDSINNPHKSKIQINEENVTNMNPLKPHSMNNYEID
jgi:hypothetical protein